MTAIRWAADTITHSGHMRLYTPSSAATAKETYQADTEFFRKNKGCALFIREAAPNEFENGFDVAFEIKLSHIYMELPKLWVLVFGDDTLYFSVPVYRGTAFFQTKRLRNRTLADTLSDRATLLLLAEMQQLGGCDNEAFENWKAKWLEAVAQHNQKALKPSGPVNE